MTLAKHNLVLHVVCEATDTRPETQMRFMIPDRFKHIQLLVVTPYAGNAPELSCPAAARRHRAQSAGRFTHEGAAGSEACVCE
jgi:hypothetical protein